MSSSFVSVLPTKTIRIRCDLAEMLAAINWHSGEAIPDFLDQMIRSKIERKFAALPEGDVKQRALDRIASMKS